jgi:hypothetical protein
MDVAFRAAYPNNSADPTKQRGERTPSGSQDPQDPDMLEPIGDRCIQAITGTQSTGSLCHQVPGRQPMQMERCGSSRSACLPISQGTFSRSAAADSVFYIQEGAVKLAIAGCSEPCHANINAQRIRRRGAEESYPIGALRPRHSEAAQSDFRNSTRSALCRRVRFSWNWRL